MKLSFIKTVTSGSFLVVLLLGAGVETQAAIRRVPTDYGTIQQAINASVNGDIVLVAPGTYAENIDFLGKAITVNSESGPLVTIIDGGQKDSVVKFVSGEVLTSVLNGFTVRNGFAQFQGTEHGGGIRIVSSSPTITNNTIVNNTGFTSGGGIYIVESSALISDNVIRQNVGCEAPGLEIRGGNPTVRRNSIIQNTQLSPDKCFGGLGGGGILILQSTAQILDNTISDNTLVSAHGGGITLFAAGSPLIRGNVISGNKTGVGNFNGGGIYIVNSSPARIIQNLITRNSAPTSGGGIFLGSVGVELVNNTIADNDSASGSGVFAGFNRTTTFVNNLIVGKEGQTALVCDGFHFDPVPPVFKFNNVYSALGVGYGGDCADQNGINGNISANPLFINPSAGDYHLQFRSPSIDTGDNSAPDVPATDLDGHPRRRIQDGDGNGIGIIDMGTYEASPPQPPFDICIQDDSNGAILKINSTSGAYQFTNCSGLILNGVGSLESEEAVPSLFSITEKIVECCQKWMQVKEQRQFG